MMLYSLLCGWMMLLWCGDSYLKFNSWRTVSTHLHSLSNLEHIIGKEKPYTTPAWPQTRPPMQNVLIFDLKMDSGWGNRGKLRAEVWDDEPDPLTAWWTTFEPSPEEDDAIDLDYDFSHPEEWFAVSL